MLNAQTYAPQVGFEGTTAIHKNEEIFVDWAKTAEVTRGNKNIAIPVNGLVDYGEAENATQKADGNPNVVSLGDGGEAILTFNYPIVNGEGVDFAIFENGFLEHETSELAFLELAFVEVSTDGEEYVRFPAITELPAETQLNSFGFTNARYIHNLAGKYINDYGTPFDLSELENRIEGTTVDLDNIQYVKIIDVIGTIDSNYATYDSQNNKVNDPYPSEFSSGGFDLDAVGVIHNTENQREISGIEIYPNPTVNKLHIKTGNFVLRTIEVFSMEGKLLITTTKKDIDISSLTTGMYLVVVKSDFMAYHKKFIKN